jgi:hypothetical protein
VQLGIYVNHRSTKSDDQYQQLPYHCQDFSLSRTLFYHNNINDLSGVIIYFVSSKFGHLQRQNVSKSEVRLTIQTMIDVLFRISGVIYYQLSLLDLALDNSFTVNGTIMDSVLIFIANAVNVYIYITFNRYE